MSRENGDSHGLWPADDQVVPLSSLTAAVAPSANGDQAASALAEERLERVELNAGEFTTERMIRPRADVPSGGWRRVVFSLSGGRVAMGPSPEDLRRRELAARVKTPVVGCRKIAFISRKGGVGKTSTTLLVGHTFATYRGDRVIAVDGNPDAGTLGHRIRRETTVDLTSLLADAGRIDRYADIRGYTSQAASRLEVIASDDDPRITQAIGEHEFHRVVSLLERHYNLVCLDTGTGVLDSATRGILDTADQIVVVSAPTLDAARAASSTLDWLEQNGFGRLAAAAVGVVNGIRVLNGSLNLDRVEEHFGKRCRATVRIPWDPHLESGAETSVEQLASSTRLAYLELAAAIASGFADSTEGR